MTDIPCETVDGFSVQFHRTLESTQITAREHFQNGTATDGDVIVAAEQTGGYGRRGRAWQSREGNLYMTLTRMFTAETKPLLYHYGFITSLAVADACRHWLGGTMAQVKLKWPNDVLVDDAKISGILLEKADRDDATVLLLGMGVNLITPSDVDQKVAAIDQFVPHPPSARDFLLVFLRFLAQYEAQLHQQGFAAVRQMWLDQAKGQGDIIAARLANGTVLEGRFLDLDHHGALLLQTDDALKTITAADIFFIFES